MTSKKIFWHVFCACLGGLLLRWLLAPKSPWFSSDAIGYDLLARNLLTHHVYSLSTEAPWLPTALREPGYPFFLALLYTLFGHSILAVQAVQIAMSLGSKAFLACTVRSFHPSLFLPVLWTLMICPFDTELEWVLLRDSFAASLVTIAITLPLFFRGSAGSLVTMTGLLSYVALVKEIYLPFPLCALLVWWIFSRKGLSQPLRRSTFVTALLCTSIILTPWTIRNDRVFHRVIPISYGYGMWNLWLGAWENPYFGKTYKLTEKTMHVLWRPQDVIPFQEAWACVTTKPEKLNDLTYKLFKERFRDKPLHVLGLWMIRTPSPWIGRRYHPENARYKALRLEHTGLLQVANIVQHLLCLLVLGTACVGFWISQKKPHAWMFLWISVPILYITGIYIPFHNVESRFVAPGYPFLLVLACVAGQQIKFYSMQRSRNL